MSNFSLKTMTSSFLLLLSCLHKGLPHSQPCDRPAAKAGERAQGTQHLRRLSYASSVLSTSALSLPSSPSPVLSLHMCLCACVSAFYLHYPCLLLATETKYFKAEKTSLPTGLLSLILLPAQEWAGKGPFQPQWIMCAYSFHVLGGQEAWCH